MRKRWRLIIGILVAALLTLTQGIATTVAGNAAQNPAVSVSAAQHDGLPDVADLSVAAGVDEAVTAGVPAFVFFFSQQCGYSAQERSVLDEVESLFSEQVIFLEADVAAESNQTLAGEWGVTGLPTMFLITGRDPSGAFVQEVFTGLTDAATLSAALSKPVDGHPPAPLASAQEPGVIGSPTMFSINGRDQSGAFVPEEDTGHADTATLSAALTKTADDDRPALVTGAWEPFVDMGALVALPDLMALSGEDTCPDDPNKTEPGICGCGIPDTDSDGDGVPDCKDQCTGPDTDSDGDGVPICQDCCDEDAEKTVPCPLPPNFCGCGTPNFDTDGDQVFDCHDICPFNAVITNRDDCAAPNSPNFCKMGYLYNEILDDYECLFLPAAVDAHLAVQDGSFAFADDVVDYTVTAKNVSVLAGNPSPLALMLKVTTPPADELTCTNPNPSPARSGQSLTCTGSHTITEADVQAGEWTASVAVEAVEPGVTAGPVSKSATVSRLAACVADDTTDSDGDGVVDCVDLCSDDPGKSEPGVCGCGVADTDTDEDGTRDCQEQCPLDPGKTEPGVCGCGVADTDIDGDGTRDCQEQCPLDPLKTEPGVCGCGVVDIDTDSDLDGTWNCVDGCPLDPRKTEPGVCGCGGLETDNDGDGVPGCLDACDDNPDLVEPTACGCEVETDEDGDGVPGCQDACPADPTKSENEGICGCGVADINSDGDSRYDCDDGCPFDPAKIVPGVCGCGVVDSDTDTDGDGTRDCLDGCPADPSKTEPGVCGCGVADTDTDGDGTADCIDPVIILTKSADPVSVPETGGPVTFTFKVDNTGPVAVELESLSDTVFGNLKDQGSCGTGGTIETDGSYSCTVTWTLAADDLATHTNKASAVVSGDEGGQATATDTAAVAFTDVAPTVTLAKTVTGPSSQLESEATFGYELAITNTSAETVTIQKLTDDHTLSRGCENLINTVIAAGKTATCAYTVQQSKPGEIANTATVTVVDNDGSTATANASASVTVRPLPTLRLAVAPTSDDGGDATLDDWTLSATAVQPVGDAFNFATPGGSGVFHKVHPGVTYSLGSAGPDGYTAGTWSCDGGTVAGASVAVMEGHNVTCTLATDDIATPPWTFPEKATLKVKALKKAKKIRSAGRTKLVRKISVGGGQTASVTVKVLPKKARKTVSVKKTKQRVVVRTGNAPRKTRILVRITSGGSGYSTTTWVRTWRVR